METHRIDAQRTIRRHEVAYRIAAVVAALLLLLTWISA
jgi:hypothetical protein